MAWSVDGRVAVVIGAAAALGDAILLEGEAGDAEGGTAEWFLPGEHAAACACCGGRSAVGMALNRLFQRRARGEVAWFERVVAVTRSAAGEAAVRAAVRDDPVASARFRIG